MNRLALIAATCLGALLLSACGDDSAPKPAVNNTEVTAPADQTNPAPVKNDKTDTGQTH